MCRIGAEAGTRTPTGLRPHDPESCASANSATSATIFFLKRPARKVNVKVGKKEGGAQGVANGWRQAGAQQPAGVFRHRQPFSSLSEMERQFSEDGWVAGRQDPLTTPCDPAREGNPDEGGTWFAFGRGVPPTGAKRRWGMAVLMPHDLLRAEYRISVEAPPWNFPPTKDAFPSR